MIIIEHAENIHIMHIGALIFVEGPRVRSVITYPIGCDKDAVQVLSSAFLWPLFTI